MEIILFFVVRLGYLDGILFLIVKFYLGYVEVYLFLYLSI